MGAYYSNRTSGSFAQFCVGIDYGSAAYPCRQSGSDDIFPQSSLNRWFAKGRKNDNEPINGSLVTIIIAFVFVVVGDVDFVAQIISMFFMVTYGAICLISLLEHFAADPAYRPTFRSSWHISLIGTLFSFWADV